jgi:hypothetical protein
MFVAQISTSFSIPVPRHVRALSQFLLYIFLLAPAELGCLKWLNSCVNLTGVVQWLRSALSKGPNWVGVFSPLHLRMETDPVSETSCFLFSSIPDDEKVQKPSNSLCYIPSSEPFLIDFISDMKLNVKNTTLRFLICLRILSQTTNANFKKKKK